MSQNDDDAFQLHARCFLECFEQLSRAFHDGDAAVDEVADKMRKWWPQILAAYWWASRARLESAVAMKIWDSLMACTNGDIARLQFRRKSADVKAWADAAANYARRLCDNPNDAAFLYRFAGIAKAQGGILEIAETTRLEVHELLGSIVNAAPQPEDKRESQSAAGGMEVTDDRS